MVFFISFKQRYSFDSFALSILNGEDILSNRVSRSEIKIGFQSVILEGILRIPSEGSSGVVIFAHGSGSSRFSPRNSCVASVLNGAGFGTLLFDLLTPNEDRDYENRFDIELLSQRLLGTTDWLAKKYQDRKYRIGYFGASTGAAAALQASAILGVERISALVSRGGRPDLAGPYLSKVQVPTLLIVGENDPDVLRLNEEALAQIKSLSKELVVIPKATHLFEEPGTLERVSKISSEWFSKYL